MKHKNNPVKHLPIILLIFSLSINGLMARDLGRHGQTFPIAEQDLIEHFHDKIREKEQNGEMDKVNQHLKQRAQEVFHIAPKTMVIQATKNDDRLFDPSITVNQDITDHEGKIVVARGTKVNPLATIPMRNNLYFIDGDNQKQLDWALSDSKSKIILLKGDVLELSQKYKRRFYYDQNQTLTKKFQLTNYPTVITQNGLNLNISTRAIQ